MRTVEIGKWIAISNDGKQIEENLLSVLSALMSDRKPEQIPRGFDAFRQAGRIGKAFDSAEKSKVLELEESDYIYLKGIVESSINSNWGMNPHIVNAIQKLMDAKEISKNDNVPEMEQRE